MKGVVFCREYQEATGFRVGFKPAGGIRTAKDAIAWLVLIKVCSFHLYVVCIRTAKDAIAWLVLIKVLSFHFHMYITGYCFILHYLGCYILQVCNTQIAGEYRINCISLLILFIFHNLLSLGGTWGLLAEQQDV